MKSTHWEWEEMLYLRHTGTQIADRRLIGALMLLMIIYLYGFGETYFRCPFVLIKYSIETFWENVFWLNNIF